MSCPSQSTQLAEFHNVFLTTQLVEFLVISNSPAAPVHHWAINSSEDFALALLGGATIVVFSRLRVNAVC